MTSFTRHSRHALRSDKNASNTHSLDDQEHQNILGYMDRLQLRRWKHQVRFLEEQKAAPDPGVALKLARDDVPPPPLP